MMCPLTAKALSIRHFALMHGYMGDTLLLPMTPQAVLAQKYENAQQSDEKHSNNAGNPIARP